MYDHVGYTVYTKSKNPLLAETETTKPVIYTILNQFHPLSILIT